MPEIHGRRAYGVRAGCPRSPDGQAARATGDDGDMDDDDGPRPEATCSARGCRAEATYVVVWNNPKVHTPEREKTWVACEDHRTSLADHLDVRGFLKRVDPLR